MVNRASDEDACPDRPDTEGERAMRAVLPAKGQSKNRPEGRPLHGKHWKADKADPVRLRALADTTQAQIIVAQTPLCDLN
jgi:hypothetical protein